MRWFSFYFLIHAHKHDVYFRKNVKREISLYLFIDNKMRATYFQGVATNHNWFSFTAAAYIARCTFLHCDRCHSRSKIDIITCVLRISSVGWFYERSACIARMDLSRQPIRATCIFRRNTNYWILCFRERSLVDKHEWEFMWRFMILGYGWWLYNVKLTLFICI